MANAHHPRQRVQKRANKRGPPSPKSLNGLRNLLARLPICIVRSFQSAKRPSRTADAIGRLSERASPAALEWAPLASCSQSASCLPLASGAGSGHHLV